MLRFSVLRTISAPALMIAVALAMSPARAQQTFECEDGGLVTVLPGQLELMKRTDPCVARHFQQPSGYDPYQPYQEMEQAPVAEPAPAVSSLAPTDVPLPSRKPEETYIAGFGPLGEGFRSAGGEESGAAQPAAAEIESDYRNVHIINGGSGLPRFYQHTR